MDIKSSIENIKTKKVTFTNTSTEQIFTGSYNELENKLDFSDDFLINTSTNTVELAGGSKNNSANNEVKQYLKDQNIDSSEKLDLPKELLEIASQAEKDGVSEK